MKRDKKIHKITKKSLEIKKTDSNFYEYMLKEVRECDKDSWELISNDGGHICCIKNNNFIPKAGMTARFYGKGFGYPVRGIDIDGHTMYYRTPQQAEEDHEKWCKDQDKERKLEFKKNKKKLDEDYNSLPDLFKQRIDKFRKNNQNFRWEYESYEMFCCKEAIKIANALKTVDAVKNWKDLNWEEQKKLVDINDGHSGNTFGCSVNLAFLYLSQNPENVVRQYGALAPLVGSEKYGCVSKENKENIKKEEQRLKTVEQISNSPIDRDKLDKLRETLLRED
jgi:hypothetical protein